MSLPLEAPPRCESRQILDFLNRLHLFSYSLTPTFTCSLSGQVAFQAVMFRLVEASPLDLVSYESISIGFEVQSRVNLDLLSATDGRDIQEIPVTPWWKDYDECEEDRPTQLPNRFNFSNWFIVTAFAEGERLGGMIVARDCPGCDMLEGRTDLAVIFDVRICDTARGQGVGKALFTYAVSRSKQLGCTELRVETQDVNVAACRFYRAMGCLLHSAEVGAYGPQIGEAKLIWTLAL